MKRDKRPQSGSLSAGSSFGASLRKRAPSLAAGLGDKDSPSDQGRAGVLVLVVRGVAALVVVSMILLVAAWLVLGLTVLPVLRVDGTPWVVKWSAWPEGAVPSGAIAMVDTGGKDTSLPGRFSMLVEPGSTRAVVEVVTGPGGQIRVESDGQTFINEVLVPWEGMFSEGETRLGDRYLVVCISGEQCTPGAPLLLPTSAVLGEVLGSLSLSPSLGPVPAAPVAPMSPPDGSPMPSSEPSPASPQPIKTASPGPSDSPVPDRESEQ